MREAETDKIEDEETEIVIKLIAEKISGTRAGACQAHHNTWALFRNFETSVLVVTSVKAIVQVDTFELIEQEFMCKVARHVMEVYLQGPFYIIITNASNSVINLAKHPWIAITNPPVGNRLY